MRCRFSSPPPERLRRSRLNFIVWHAGTDSLPLKGGGWRRRRRVGVPAGLGVCGGTPTRPALRVDLPLSGLSYSHILPSRREADSVRFPLIRGRKRWLGLNMGWGGLATAAWKKGGQFACGAGGAAWLLRASAGRNAGTGDSVYAVPAQRLGDRNRDGGSCRRAYSCSGCRP